MVYVSAGHLIHLLSVSQHPNHNQLSISASRELDLWFRFYIIGQTDNFLGEKNRSSFKCYDSTISHFSDVTKS